MNTTQTQTNTAVLIAFIAGALSGRGWFGFDQATWVTILTCVSGAGMAIWTSIATRQKALVSTVNAMPEVAGVVTTKTPEGIALAQQFPDPTIAPQGSAHAMDIAKESR